MPDSVSIRIGEQTRELRFGLKAVQAAERMLGGEDIQTVTLTKLSTINLYRIAAAGFSTYGVDAKRIAPPQVERWVELEPKKLAELERAVVLAVTLHLQETGKVTAEDARVLGEALASAAPASAGTSASDSAGASASTPPKT
jgi:hypothetical protein